MLVADLQEAMSGSSEQSRVVTLGDLEVTADADRLTVAGGPEFPFDEQAERALAAYLDINKSYLAKCPPDLKQRNVNHWLGAKANTEAVVNFSGDHLVSVHQPDLLVLPLAEVSNIITRLFKADDEVVTLIRDEERFHIDIKTDHHVEVRPDERFLGRQVGDITHGGVRILATPFSTKNLKKKTPPEVRTYLHRLWCTNGCTSPTAESTIRLRSHTLPEILQELEVATREVLSGLDDKLAAYAATADVAIPGNYTAFAYQLGRESELPVGIMDRIVSQTNNLPENSSLYDILNIFTETANQGTVAYTRRADLQNLAGLMAFRTEHVVHRCSQCERPLPHE